LEIGNDTYHPLELKDEFFPERWVWVQSINEPMLSLPYDYDILSLGLLNYQVRSMTIQLKDQPSGCLAELNSSCQNLVVGRALLDNVTRGKIGELSRQREVVCVEMIEKDGDISSLKYRCCSPGAAPLIHCDIPLKSNSWFTAIKAFLIILSVLATLYYPGLPLALPDCIFNLQHERDKEDRIEDQSTISGQAESNTDHSRNGYERIIDQNEEENRLTRPLTSAELPVDDASPITCSTLMQRYVQRLPDLRLSFNVKVAFMMCCLIPFFFFVQLYLALKQQKYRHELLVKLPPGSSLSNPRFSFDLAASFTLKWSLFFLLPWAFTTLMAILFLRPKDLFLRKMWCPMCRFVGHFIMPKAEKLKSAGSIGEKMLVHLMILRQTVYSLMSFFLKLHISGLKKLLKLSNCPLPLEKNCKVSRITQALCVLWVMFSILPALLIGFVLGALCSLFFFVTLVVCLVFFSPAMSLFFSLVVKVDRKMGDREMNCGLTHLVRLIFSVYSAFLTLSFFLLMVITCNFIVGMLGFTIMGLVLNVEIVTPYVAFFLVVTTNIYLCYANLQSRYKEVKGLILQYRQKKLQITDGDQGTIPTQLFWFVCDSTFPVEREICLMFRNMAVIVTFLFLALSSIIFFGNSYNISTVVSTITVFVSGVIPGLFFNGLTKGENFSGWAKITMKREIETAVQAYYSTHNDNDEEESLNDYMITAV